MLIRNFGLKRLQNHVKVREEEANNNKQAKIKVVKVNLDQQEWWDKNL